MNRPNPTVTSLCLAAASILLSVLSQAASAQGFLLDERPEIPLAGSFQVKALTIDSSVREQVAEVQVSQVFHNPTRSTMEVEYWFPLPDDGAVQSVTLLVDGKEMPGRILPRDEARRIYEEIVRRKQDPALVEYMGRSLFRTRVFPIPAGADRKVTLRYTQLLKRDRDTIRFDYPLSTQRYTSKPIEKLNVHVTIEHSDPIKSVFSPTHDVAIDRAESGRRVTADLQLRNTAPGNDFQLIYTLGEQRVSATVLSYWPGDADEGYFMVLASPGLTHANGAPPPKSMVFVIDKSGSMSGKKITQAKGALRFVLNNLNKDDTFNMIAYDDRVLTYKPELQRYDNDARNDAVAWVDNLRDGGSTNIDEALRQAMGMFKDQSRPGYVLFLTDGLPTAGEQNEMKIARNCERANESRARLFAFGVGYDVNARLLDRLSSGNHGTSEYVKPDADIEAAVSNVFSKLTAPVLTGVEIRFERGQVNRTFPRDLPDIFEGGQLVWVGRYASSRHTDLIVTGKVGSSDQQFTYPAELVSKGEGHQYAFIEKLWAQRRVGDLIDQIDLHGQSDELMKELIELSTRHGILTPYTSYLADEDVEMGATAGNMIRTRSETRALDRVSGRAGAEQRAYKQAMKAAPTTSNAPAGAAAEISEPERLNLAQKGNAIAVDTDGVARVVQTVRNVANRAFFRKDNRWVDSTLNETQIRNATEIQQFSDRYFALVRSQTAAQNRLMVFDEDVLVNLDGKAYLIRAVRNP